MADTIFVARKSSAEFPDRRDMDVVEFSVGDSVCKMAPRQARRFAERLLKLVSQIDGLSVDYRLADDDEEAAR